MTLKGCDVSYRIAKIVVIGGMILYWIVGNTIFSDLCETDFNVAITSALVCLFTSMFFLICYVCLISFHHFKTLYKKIDELNRKEIMEHE